MKTGLNQVLILPVGGLYTCFGVNQPLKIDIMTLKKIQYII